MIAPVTRADSEPPVISVGYQNLHNGGIDGTDDARLQQMVDRLADADLDAVLLGEARWLDRGDRQLHQVAERLGASFRCRVRSNYYGCDMAVFIREGTLRVAEERHENDAPTRRYAPLRPATEPNMNDPSGRAYPHPRPGWPPPT